MRKRKVPFHNNKGLAKTFAIASEPKGYAPSKQFSECSDVLHMLTDLLGPHVHLINGIGMIRIYDRGLD